ncbi:hypothetical protein RHGRI_006565 [Rhododendron griersonianum]|uniref:Uncharacterized protein n=1 Tax=Rhododendron griersonianum TaxID=479676 RepID=A0AAV6KUP8_9ERIC|nr:hypothetical protein RHGRI_006565 [Rhododendron griersonianum]
MRTTAKHISHLVPSFLDLMGGDNEINWDWKLRIDEVMNLVWLDGWDANGVVWRYLKLDGLKFEVLLVINTLTGKRYLLDGNKN